MTRRLRANHDTPRCADGVLLLPSGATITIGSPEWQAWLAEPAHTTFYFAEAGVGCTLRREARGGSQYWYAYARHGGRLRKAYLGRSADLAHERLCAAARQLAAGSAPRAPAQPQAALATPAEPGLLVTKLNLPTPPARLVARPHLTARLDAALSATLTLVAAPAGYGKSTLLAEWLAARSVESKALSAEFTSPTQHSTLNTQHFKVAWLALDAADNDPARFWRYVLAAIERARPGMAAEALLLLHAGQPADALLTSLINRIAAAPTLTIVLALDDYHLIETAAIHTSMATLIDRSPPNLHLVLAARSLPDLPLARLRARGQLNELRAPDLRFSQAETAAFLAEVMHLSPPPATLAALEYTTEGWVAGIQLAALSQQRGAHGPHLPAAQNQHAVLEYLADEVFTRLAPELQAFLLRSAIAERFCAALCDALHPGGPPAQLLIDELERANLFLVPLDGQRHWFRYHHLFAGFLRDRLARAAPEPIGALHSRAAHWFEQRGLAAEAISHALAGGESAHAARLVRFAAERLVRQGELLTLRGWLEALPRELLWHSAELSLWYAWALALTRRAAEAEPWLARVEHLAGQLPESIERAGQLAQAAVVRTTIAAGAGDLESTIRYAEQALATLPRHGLVLRAVVALNLGLAHINTGQPARASAALAEALELSRACAHHFTYASAAFQLGRLHRAQGRLHAAALVYRAAQRQLAAHDQRLALARIEVALAELLCERNELDEAERLLAGALPLIEHSGPAGIYALGCLAQARIHLARGRLPAARASLAAAELAEPELAELAAWRARIERGQGESAPAEPLSPREREVLALIAEGLSDAAIAARLGIAVGTARWHTKHILAKLGVHNRTSAALAARELAGYHEV